MRRTAWLSLIGLVPVVAHGLERPEWAFPVADKVQPPSKDDDQPKSLSGSTKSYTQVQIDDLKNPPDWFPDMHPPMPSGSRAQLRHSRAAPVICRSGRGDFCRELCCLSRRRRQRRHHDDKRRTGRPAGGKRRQAKRHDDTTLSIANYWPYATTLFDYVRRAMPWTSPRTLTDDQVYALTAYILAQNKLIDAKQVINAQTLPKVQMPNRNGFIPRFPERMPPG